MPASQDRGQTLISCIAAQTLSAFRVVRHTGTRNTVNLYDTTTSLIFGVTADDSADGTGTSVKVVLAGTAKVACAASVSAGALVTAQSATSSGLIMEVGAHVNNTTTAATPKILGIAMQAGSTNSVIEVALRIENVSKIAYA